MSKRLAISSLLCDDEAVRPPPPVVEPQIIPEPVVLAPHLRKSLQRVDTDSHSRNQYPNATSNAATRSAISTTTSPPLASSPTSSRLGLDALVHAASEERRRLSVSGPSNTNTVKGSPYQPAALITRNPAEDSYAQYHGQYSANLSPLHELKLRTTNPISPLLTQQQQPQQRRTIPLDEGGPVHLSPVEDFTRRAGPSRSPFTFPSPSLPPTSYRPSSSHSSPSVHHASPPYHHLSPPTEHPRERSRDREREQVREREAREQDLQFQQRHHQRQQQQFVLIQQERQVHRDRILGYGSAGENRAAQGMDVDRPAPQPSLLDRDRHGRKSDPLPGPGMRSILSPTMERSHVMPSSLSGPGIASGSSAYANYMPMPTPTQSSHLQAVQSSHTSRPSTSSSFFHADWDQPTLDRGDERSSKKRRHSDTSPVRNDETRTGDQGIGPGEELEKERGREREKESGERDRLRGRERERREVERFQRERDKELECVRREQERRGFDGTDYPGPNTSSGAITSPRPTSIAAIISPSITAITSPTRRRAGAGYDPVHELDRPPSPHSQEHSRKRSYEMTDNPERDGERDEQRFGGSVATPVQGPGAEQHEVAGVARTVLDHAHQQPPRMSQTSFHHRINDRDPVHSAHRDFQAFLQSQMQTEPSRRHSHHVEQEQQPHSPQFPRIPQQPVTQHQHRVVSPISIGRRSPPGSQVGRAIAARKVEIEHQQQQMFNVESNSNVCVKDEKREVVLLSTSQGMGRPTSSGSPSSPRLSSEQLPLKTPEEKVGSDRKKFRDVATDISAKQETKLHADDGLSIKPEKMTPVSLEAPSSVISQQPTKPSIFTSVSASHASRPHPTPLTKPVNAAQRPPPVQSQSTQYRVENEDAHEWFLEHYADDTSELQCRPQTKQLHSTASANSAPRESPVRTAAAQSDPVRLSTKSPTSPKHPPRPPTPVTRASSTSEDNDAVMALEQELELGLAEASAEYRKKAASEDAMDVDDADADQAVTELMEEALRTGRKEEVDVTSEIDKDESAVDVEDELLSLLDDRPHSSTNDGPKHHTQSTSIPGTKSSKSTKHKTTSKHPPPKSPALKLRNESVSQPVSPLAVSGPSGKSATRSPSVGAGGSAVRASSVRPQEKDDRESMPPPATPNREKGEQEKGEIAMSAPQPKKKGKPGPKHKARNSDSTAVGAPPPAPPKPRGKPGPKPKPRDEFGNIIRAPPAPAKASKGSASATPAPQPSRTGSASAAVAGGSGARSRSTSVLPGGSVGPEGDAGIKDGEDDQEPEDDKLYCVCKTQYDEDRAMIACDSCDEWYHMQCVGVQDHLVDLVDQFFCPLCIEKNPTRNLQTTYKPRCLFGLDSPDPDSPKACHKPARPFSKYCSDACGMKNMRKRIDAFTKKGGKKDDLWETVKDATAREGLVKCVEEIDAIDADGTGRTCVKVVIKEVKPAKSKQDREIERLNALLGGIEKLRDELKRDMDIILWREKLLQLASDRAESVAQCGWDQRLCFSDEDWADYGEGVLESYAELGEDQTNTDGEGEWWCPGEQDCERHAGWQVLRAKDVDKEKEKKEEALMKLTTRERDIRKRLDSMVEEVGPLPGRGRSHATPIAPSKPSNKLTNGYNPKSKVNGDATKKGKKRKAPS